MPRFIKTYHNDNIVIKRMLICNSCNLMKFYPEENTSVCRQYVDKLNITNIIKKNITTYKPSSKKITEVLPIPKWCGLPDKLSDSYFSKDVFKITPNSINISYQDTAIDIKIYDAETFKKINVDIDTLIWDKKNIEKTQKSNILYNRDSDSDYRKSWDTWGKNEKTTSNVKLNSNILRCSLCGEDDKSVDRQIHFGMCDRCWNLSDIKTKKRAFINNFRLKRNIDFTHNKFKYIKELKLKKNVR